MRTKRMNSRTKMHQSQRRGNLAALGESVNGSSEGRAAVRAGQR
jgi:hypothetical protein